VLQYCVEQAGDVERVIPRELRVEWRSLSARVRAYVLSRPPDLRAELLRETPSHWRSLQVASADIGVSDAQLAGAGLVPGRTSVCGTDDQGRDILARMLFGVRISMSVGVIAVAIYVTIGVILGGLAGFFAGKTDILVQRLIEVMMCFPALILIMIIVGMRETRTIFLIMVVIGLTRWTGVARLTRGEYLRLRTQDFVVAAEALGVSNLKIIFRHILPNAIAPVLVSATFGVAGAILLEATLSFLGLGDLRSPSWGQILNLGRQNHQCQWLIWIPGLAIFATVSALNFVGEAFRDAIDPKLRQ